MKKRTRWYSNYTVLVSFCAAALAVFAMYYFYTSLYSQKNYQSLYDSWHQYTPNNYFNTSTGLPYEFQSYRDTLTTAERRAFRDAFSYYQEKQFNPTSPFLASTYFTKAMEVEKMKRYPEIFFFYTLALEEQGETSSAIENFNYLLSLDNQFVYQEESKWNLALLLIKSGQAKKAIPLLKEIQAGSNSTLKEKATSLLTEL